jgi:integrase/recombinase XerD
LKNGFLQHFYGRKVADFAKTSHDHWQNSNFCGIAETPPYPLDVAVFLSPETTTQARRYLASLALLDAYTDFVLSRQAKNCTPATMAFYGNTAGKFLEWIESQGVTDPGEVSARHVRQYLAQLISMGLKDTTTHDHARAIRTLLKFWHAEGYILSPVKFDMPKFERKRLPVLSPDELKQLIKQCNPRDRAIILLIVDSGLRRSEVSRLNWDDLDVQTGLIRVKQGKGKKDRSSVIGATTRRALLAYRRTLADRDGPMFQGIHGGRLSSEGLLLMFTRISKRTGIHVTAHALRRTFGRSYGRLVNASKGCDLLTGTDVLTLATWNTKPFHAGQLPGERSEL